MKNKKNGNERLQSKKATDRHLDVPSEANRDKHINFTALENRDKDPGDQPATGKLSPSNEQAKER